MSHPNETMLRDAYDAFSKGEIGALTAMLSGDISWHASGESPAAGDYTGTDGVLQFFASMMAVYDGTLEVTVEDVLAGDLHGVVLTHERGTHDGRRLEYTSVHVWTIRDGKCTAFVSYEDDVYRKFWATRPTF